MFVQKLAFFAFLGVASVGAFSVGKPSTFAGCRPSTCLYSESAEEGDSATEETTPAGEDHMLPDEGGSDILSSPAFLARKLDVLKSDIAKAEEELVEINQQIEEGKAEWGDQIEALSKEYENISNRMTQQSAAGDEDAVIQVTREMLAVLDNFDRAFGIVTPETESEKEIDAAYRSVYQSILDVFKDLGVTEIETVGKEFDYEVHQAVMQRPSEDYEEGIVCEELQKGFILDQRLIRAAMVSVAA
mmetsp:Transcript_10868/g.15322  ORF Transcript_10868/g.15322 Transcript_10868/m.15322 type:complete len:245 (-) Transcript_10868:95-829(-)